MSPSASSSYVLRYFNIPGIAETSRMLLTAALVDWKEENPEWPLAKSDQPFGRVPVLIEEDSSDGSKHVLCESPAIERYLARKYGFMPTELKLASRQEEIREQQIDTIQAFFNVNRFEGSKEFALGRFYIILDRLLNVHSAILRENGNNGHYFGDRLTYVDIGAYGIIRAIVIHGKGLENERSRHLIEKITPEFKKLVETVESDPLLQAHFANSKILSMFE
ncbi:hypothetical protein GGI15_002291 [Coemansia interrupta]|uniref:Glutathione S-transferase n=1 Tax=Coemansia interrupta TaxID=1126814 RepID=A0A9W8HEK2_9FUNG|nr:hypothetical protein GGI15_002291 [Coemansia interrupta]